MSALRKTIRALDFDQAWPDILLAACQLCGAEYTRELTMAVTLELADQIAFDEDTLAVDVSGVDDDAVIEAVQKLMPKPEPVVEPEPIAEPEPAPEPVPEPDEAE